MTNPSKIVNFLDIAGTWRPSLIFVMGGDSSRSGLLFDSEKLEKPLVLTYSSANMV